MMFHRTKPPVTIDSREEENELGREWSRTVWPVGAGGPPPAAVPAPEPPAASAVPETDAASGEGDPPDAPHPSWAPDESPAEPELKAGTPLPPNRPQLTYNKLPTNLAAAAEEAKANVKRPRAATVKPTGKPKKKSRDW